jgi:hypothetical protein
MMFHRSSLAVAAAFSLMFLLADSTDAFVGKPTFATTARGGTRSTTRANMFGFLNDGKKALVKSLAGEYDAPAIQARMQGLINDNTVLMLSFTT